MPPDPRIETETVDAKGLSELLRDPEVEAVTRSMPTSLIRPLSAERLSEASGLWGISAVCADESGYSGSSAVVAVLDTGIDEGHEAFAGLTTIKKDFSGRGNDDVHGHGTHCAGTIFGRDLDGKRIGVARGVSRALIGKVLTDDGGGTSEMIFDGICWAMAHGANVIAMSLGFDFPGLVRQLTSEGWPIDLATSHALEAYRGNLRMFDALMAMIRANQAFGTGSVVVAAAGNESRRNIHPDYEIAASLPAAAEGVISVGAAARGDLFLTIGEFSNAFPQVVAPGVDIASACSGGGLVVMTGTSMACPHVAGVAALWWESVRAAGLPARADTVVAKLLSGARTNVFAPGVGLALRGAGLVTAP